LALAFWTFWHSFICLTIEYIYNHPIFLLEHIFDYVVIHACLMWVSLSEASDLKSH
jgi:prolipoprotein diacylglyceryltransferase